MVIDYASKAPEQSNYLQTRAVSEEALHTLGVVESTVTDGHARCSNRQPTTIKEIAATVTIHGSLVTKLDGGGKIKNTHHYHQDCDEQKITATHLCIIIIIHQLIQNT